MPKKAKPAAAAAKPKEISVVHLDVDKVLPSRLNPRGSADLAGKALAELVSSVKEKGVLTPLLVRLHGSVTSKTCGVESKTYELAAGHRRLAAAKLAGLKTVPCIVREMGDDEFAEVMITDNLMRRDVHPLDEAEGFRALMAERGWDAAEMGRRVGKPESYVARRTKLCDLVPKAARMFRDGRMLLGHAEALCRHVAKDQEKAITDDANWENRRWTGEMSDFSHDSMPTVAAFEKYLQDTFTLDLGKAPFSKTDPELLPKAGACASCPLRTGCVQSLFPDIASKDTCTSPRCFADKLQAHVEREVSRGRKPLSNSSGAGSADGRFPDAVIPSHWFEPGKEGRNLGYSHPLHGKKIPKCDRLAKAVVSDGERKGRLLTACFDDSCKVHFAKGAEKKKKAKRQAGRGDAATSSGVSVPTYEQLQKARERLTENRIAECLRFRDAGKGKEEAEQETPDDGGEEE